MSKKLEKENEEIETEETEETETEEVETDGEETEGEETEEEVKENLKNFIQSETKTASIEALDAKLDEMAKELVSKFYAGVEAQRKAAIKGVKTQKNLSDQEVVRKWFTALRERDASTLRAMEKDFLNTDTDRDGGFLVPTPLVAEVARFVEEYGIARRDMRYLPFSGAGNSRMLPALASAVQVFWAGQGEKKPSSIPQFKLVEQTLKKLVAICPMSEEMLEDPAIDIIRLLGELFGEAVALEEDRVFFTGKVDSGDQYNGVVEIDDTVEVLVGGDDPTAEKFGNFLADALNRAKFAVPTQVRNKGKFYMNSAYFSLLQRVKDSNGNYLIQNPTADTEGYRIWQRPIELLDVLADDNIAVEGTPIAFYTDLSKTCVYGDKGGLRVKYLTEATVSSAGESPTSINLAEQDMVALRISKRTGYVPLLPSGIAVVRLGTES